MRRRPGRSRTGARCRCRPGSSGHRRETAECRRASREPVAPWGDRAMVGPAALVGGDRRRPCAERTPGGGASVGYPRAVADLPFPLQPGPALALAAALDRERKIDRALDALGPLVDRDVVLVGAGSAETERWSAAGARVTALDSLVDDGAGGLASDCADAILSSWSGFQGIEPTELAAADRLLRPSG